MVVAENATLYERVAGHVNELVKRGTLSPGDRVPSVRKLSRQLGVSVSTVLQAYTLLENRGVVSARPQSGFYVRAPLARPPEPTTMMPARATAANVRVNDLVMEIIAATSDPSIVCLGAAIPSPLLMPTQHLNRLMGRIGRNETALAHGYSFPPGYRPLRVQIARRALEAGCALGPDDIITTCGCQEAITLCLRAVTKPGDSVAVESPTFYGLLQAIESLHLKAVEVPTSTREGVDITALPKVLDRTKVAACLFTTNFGNPLGHMMPEGSKRELVKLLAARGIPLIEDDLYGEMVHGPERPRTCKSFDRNGMVLLCSSFSKTLSAGMRLGWTAPGKFKRQVEQLKLTNTICTPSISEMVVAEFLEGGAYDRHLRRIRREFADNVQRVTAAIQKWPVEICLTRPQGGFVLWVELPKNVDALRLHRESLMRKISIAPGPIFSASGAYRNCVRLNCGLPWGPEVEKALATLGTLVARQAKSEVVRA